MHSRLLSPLVPLLASAVLAAPPPPVKKPAVPQHSAATTTSSAQRATAKVPPVTSKYAPSSVPHPTAMFLANWSQEGKREVSFKATAVGTRFILEDRSGVTVYRFDGTGYVAEMFLLKGTLSSAKKRLGIP